MLVGLHILCAPEDAIVQTEHIEGGHGGNAGHNPTNPGAVLKAGGNNLILRAEAREERNTGNGQTADEERDVGHRHVLAQTTHQGHLVGVDGVDNTTGTEEAVMTPTQTIMLIASGAY